MLQFDGDTIEEALAAAAKVLGPNVQVAEARKVRKGGVGGFFAQERFEIDAFEGDVAPAAAAPQMRAPVPRPRSLDQAFDQLLAEIEETEMPQAPATNTHWTSSLNQFLDEEASAAPLVGRHFAAPGQKPNTVAAEARTQTATTPSSIAQAYVEEPVAPKTDPTALVAPDADARVRRARLGGGEPNWSEEALFAMGVPKVICDAVAAACAITDLEWMAALEAAIIAKTPPTARSNELLCTLGQGRKAAIAMLRAGVAGIPPGILYIDGNEVVATPTELALAVRGLLPR
jgi:hypothetical protein